jgi:hypothetical protein
VPVGTPLVLMLEVSTESFVSGQTPSGYPSFVASGESTTDFSHTLGFPTSGPIFNLPDGYTVNSISGLIVTHSCPN